jgi:hypothetical protein
MSGTIEQLHAKVDAILAILQAGAAAPQGLAQPQVQPQALAQPQMLAQPLAQPQAVLGVAGQPAQQFAAVSAEQITALITPHVGDPNLKAALQQQMAAMGIGALPDAQPHQYGELYARFQQVISQFQAAAQQQPQQQASII